MSLSEPMRHRQTSNAMGKILHMKTWILLFLVVFGAGAYAHNYNYSDLMISDYDEMNQQVQVRIRNAHKKTKGGDDNSGDKEAIGELRDALKLVFSRPNSDNMVSKLTPDLRRELGDFSAFEDTISSIVAESLSQVKDDTNSVAMRSTALFVLENALSEIRPEVSKNEDMRRIVQRVADAKIKISEDVIKDRKLRSMFKTRNPSDFADEILKSQPKKDAKEKAK
jgi:hypothetical protein